MVPRENKNNASAKSGGTNKECYGIFRNGLLLLENVLDVTQFLWEGNFHPVKEIT